MDRLTDGGLNHFDTTFAGYPLSPLLFLSFCMLLLMLQQIQVDSLVLPQFHLFLGSFPLKFGYSTFDHTGISSNNSKIVFMCSKHDAIRLCENIVELLWKAVQFLFTRCFSFHLFFFLLSIYLLLSLWPWPDRVHI